MNTRNFAVVVVALVFGLTTPCHLAATVLLPADFSRMVTESQVIVHARVIDVEGQLAGPRRSIESVVTVTVLSSLKGQAGEEAVFRVPGGRVGRYRRIVIGAPVFTPGDEVVLFLKSRGPEVPMPFGLSQGVYRVSRVTGAPMVMPIPPPDNGTGAPRGDAARKPVALDDFARQIRTAGAIR